VRVRQPYAASTPVRCNYRLLAARALYSALRSRPSRRPIKLRTSGQLRDRSHSFPAHPPNSVDLNKDPAAPTPMKLNQFVTIFSRGIISLKA
jgi:hypothetical protein